MPTYTNRKDHEQQGDYGLTLTAEVSSVPLSKKTSVKITAYAWFDTVNWLDYLTVGISGGPSTTINRGSGGHSGSSSDPFAAYNIEGTVYLDWDPDTVSTVYDTCNVYVRPHYDSSYGSSTLPRLEVDIPIVKNSAPTGSISASGIAPGATADVSWSLTDPEGDTISNVSLTRYYKAKGASSWTSTPISVTASSRGVRDSIPSSYGGGTVYYRLVCRDSRGNTATIDSSNYSVVSNSAPTTPSSISVPSAISGGTAITVSWGSSTDTDGNLEGYILERSVDGGSRWTQVYQGSARTTTNTVAAGTTTVMYRVKAYDALGAESGYRTSSQVTVSNNSAPSIPTSITVSNIVVTGQNLSVSWGESTDPDGDTVGYELSRSIDSGASYEIVYSGPNRAFVDSVGRTWTKVKYRVRAFDPSNAYSDYKESPERTVTSNNIPRIVCEESGSLGTKNDTFDITYAVADDDPTDTLTVYEKLDGVTRRSFVASRNTEYTFSFTDGNGDSYWQKILNGSHTIELSVSDTKSTGTLTLTFIKKVTGCTITMSNPRQADDHTKLIDACLLSFEGSLPTGRNLKVEVTNNALDTTPVWEDITSKVLAGTVHTFVNTTAASESGFAFNFRITASRGTVDAPGFFTSVQGAFSVASDN